jgi:hypothetical protein
VGHRDQSTANAFVEDLAGRMKNRVQVSTDGLGAYVQAIERGFGTDVDYGQIIKTYGVEESIHPQRRYIDDLRDVIHKLHGVKATHVESIAVKEVFQGKTIWDGIVEVFDLHNHPTTHRAYAWSHETDNNGNRHITVLHIPPAISPETAVRAAIIQEFKNAQPA